MSADRDTMLAPPLPAAVERVKAASSSVKWMLHKVDGIVGLHREGAPISIDEVPFEWASDVGRELQSALVSLRLRLALNLHNDEVKP